MAGTAPRLAADDARLATRHLLALPGDVQADEVEVLAVSRFPTARWHTPVPTTPPRGRAARDPLAGVGLLRLTRHSSAVGPYALAADDVLSLGVPADSVTAFLVQSPRERGAPPYPGGDRDGLKRAFPDGVPIRDEERVLRWLVDAARRLGGAVRIADGAAVLVPDPQAAVDLTVHTTHWLEPRTALAVVQRVVPGARLAMDAARWSGPASLPGSAGADPTVPPPVLGERVRRRLHDRADAFDAAALAAPDELAGYGLEVDLGADGIVAVDAGGDDIVPVVLRGLSWSEAGTVTYRVRWEPADVEELEREVATPAHRAARDRVQPLVNAVARSLHEVVGGEVADAAEFLLDSADL